MRIITQVENLLRQDPELRDSDKKLLLAVWEQQGLFLDKHQQQVFMDCATAESVTRARRALKVKYPASPEVEQERFNKFRKYKAARGPLWWSE